MLLKQLKNRSGMTLIEVLVAFTVSLIILIGAFSVFLPTIKHVNYNNNLAEAKNTSTLLIKSIHNKVQFATEVEIKAGSYTVPSLGADRDTIYQEADLTDPDLIKFMYTKKTATTGNEILSGAFFQKLRYEITYSISADTCSGLEVHIQVFQKNRTETIFKTMATVTILNVRNGSGSLDIQTGITTGNYIEFS